MLASAMRKALVLALLAAALAAMGRGATPRSSAAAQQTISLSVAVERPAGPPVLLRFMIRAASADAADEVVRQAALEAIPGGRIVDQAPGLASAQYRFWSWKWDDAELPVPVAYNPSGAIPGFAPQAVVAALETWSEVPGSRFAFRYAGITENLASLHDELPDGENVIQWRSLPCTPAACALGVTSKEATHEADLVLNNNPAARLGDGLAGAPVDARTVVLHETGHMAGLEHSCPPLAGPCSTGELNAVMYYQYVGVHRSLAADDVAGMAALYPSASGAPGPLPYDPGRPVLLEPGWNLAVLPAGDVGETMAALLCAEAIYNWNGDAWEVWLRGLEPARQRLREARLERSYWIKASGTCAHFFP